MDKQAYYGPVEAIELNQVVRSLRSVRRFSPRPIPEDVLLDVLESARWTGSAKNTQPWHLILLRERETLRALSACGQFAYHLADATLGVALVMNGRGNAFDAGRLAQNIMLAAWAHGVGSCVASLYPEANNKRARHLLGIPPERSIHSAISLGYPADERALRLSADRGGLTSVPIGRQELSDLVSWERFGESV